MRHPAQMQLRPDTNGTSVGLLTSEVRTGRIYAEMRHCNAAEHDPGCLQLLHQPAAASCAYAGDDIEMPPTHSSAVAAKFSSRSSGLMVDPSRSPGMHTSEPALKTDVQP